MVVVSFRVTSQTGEMDEQESQLSQDHRMAEVGREALSWSNLT